MNVLITGANGFVGKNLTQRLSTIKDRRDRTRPVLQIEEILLCTRDTSAETLADYCKKANFVVHLAGVNRPQDPGEFAAGNTDFTRTLLEILRKGARYSSPPPFRPVWPDSMPGVPMGSPRRRRRSCFLPMAEKLAQPG